MIRAMEPEDAEGFWAVADGASVIDGTAQLPLRSKASRRKQADDLDDPWDRHRLVADLGGQVVGMCGLHLSRSPRKRHAGSIGMSVHKDHHGTGVGSALLAAILDLGHNWLNLHRIDLEVYTDNEAGVALYKKFGFEIEGTLRHYSFRNGKYVDAYAMSRLT